MHRLLVFAEPAEAINGTIAVSLDSADPVFTRFPNAAAALVFDGPIAKESENNLNVSIDVVIRQATGGVENAQLSRRVPLSRTRPLRLPFEQPATFDPATTLRHFITVARVPDGLFENSPVAEPRSIALVHERLGFGLHPDHLAILATTGAWRSPDLYMPDIDGIETAWRQLPSALGANPEDYDISDKARQILHTSTMVMIAVGDGHSALLFDSATGSMYVIEEDEHFEPLLMRDADGTSLGFRAAMGRFLESNIDLLGAEPEAQLTLSAGTQTRLWLALVRRLGKLEIEITPYE